MSSPLMRIKQYKTFYYDLFMLAVPVALQGLITIGVNVATNRSFGTFSV